MKDIEKTILFLKLAIAEFKSYPTVVEGLNRRLIDLKKMKILNKKIHI